MSFPEGTFIPKLARIFCILHLSIAFTIVLGVFFSPFLKDLFDYKSKMNLYEYVMGGEKNPVTRRHKDRFENLTHIDKTTILSQYHALKRESETSFIKKIGKAIFTFINDSIYFQTWLILSLILPIWILKKREGAEKAAFILPLLIFLYALSLPLEVKLSPFPSEQYLIDNFIKKPLPSDINEQYHLLLEGWNKFLIEVWAKETPFLDLEKRGLQIEKGEHAFYVNLLKNSKDLNSTSTNKLLLCIYLIWNVLFAFIVNKFHDKKIACF